MARRSPRRRGSYRCRRRRRATACGRHADRNLAEAITARAEIVAAADQPEGAVSVATLRIVGPNAVGDERYRLAEAWAEGGEDARGIAERTKHLTDLEDLLVLAGATVTT